MSIGKSKMFTEYIQIVAYSYTWPFIIIQFFYYYRAILEIKTSLLFPLFQWLMYLIVLIWFIGVAVYLSSMKLYVFKVKGLVNDLDCVCNSSYYKVPIKSNNYKSTKMLWDNMYILYSNTVYIHILTTI